MRRSTIVFAVLLASCSQDPAAPTRHSSGQPSASSRPANTPVSSTVADADPSIGPSLQIRSDGGGAYKSSKSVVSQIQSIGDWELDLTSGGSTRTIYLDFSRPIAGSGPNGGAPISIPSGNYKVHLISKCSLVGNSYFTVAPGSSVTCPLHIGSITVGANTYAVQMNPGVSSAGLSFPETNYANVDCIFPSSGSGPCTQWSITPSATAADGSASNVAALLLESSSPAVKEGDYLMSFRFTLTNP